jgi:glycerophosphoryl diester phosphodiesterase
MRLPEPFLTRPIAHRALHDRSQGRPENSRAAVAAAIEAGYGIEIDLQLSADGVAMVFHDYALGRLTGTQGAVRQRTAAELGQIGLLSGNEGIPTFREILDLVAGRVPLLVEVKDQDGGLGADVGPLERATAADAVGYTGPIAFMSFNPNSMLALADHAPEAIRGLTTEDFVRGNWPNVATARRAELTAIPDIEATQACFISHGYRDLDTSPVGRARSRGLSVLCFTIRSPAQEAEARLHADNITFEGYLPT